MMAAAWRALLREAWERSVVFTQFICFLNVFSNHVAEVHQVSSKIISYHIMAADES
jgi:hypothetical protein